MPMVTMLSVAVFSLMDGAHPDIHHAKTDVGVGAAHTITVIPIISAKFGQRLRTGAVSVMPSCCAIGIGWF